MGKGKRLKAAKAQRLAKAAAHREAQRTGPNEIKIECPVTGAFVSTGVVMDTETFMNSSMRDMSFGCKECGGSHKWQEHQAVVNA